MLTISELDVWYDPAKKIINSGSFRIAEHSITGLLGINGSGKTTLINALTGVHKKYALKECIWFSQEMSFLSEDFKLFRYTVFTEHKGFRFWSFNTYLSFIEKIYNIPRNQSALETLLKGFNFNEFVDKKISELSTGNTKKVFLITGLYLKRKLLILDEPFDGLDFSSTEFLYKQINEYRQYGSVFMSSHISESFDRTCDSLILLADGHLEQKDFDKSRTLREQISEVKEDVPSISV